ncbi:mediator of RNA polymerase II transcription subunit 17-like [Artemia franciscana]|uniref:Mediator of RNA polymerase II transcription subunit 17 n=1 Tax=Artemia franciscana TaxID=6661 RepID=A0AA88L6I6_ARTSF|nr:hypothetical protein QYM36_004258 [Artemia franciscana]
MDENVSSVNVHVEVPSEYTIQEITFTGEEIYQAPPSLSETLAKLASKVDWSVAAETAEKAEDEEDSQPAPPLLPSHHWDSVKAKINASFAEISVLHDVLQIAKQKTYLVFDPVQQESTENRPYAQLLAKKRGLTAASTLLINGAERLRVRESVRESGSQQQFHADLAKLRLHWRLKKLSSTSTIGTAPKASILGDLSYKSVGSRVRQIGTFEVAKAEEGGGESINFIQNGTFEVSSLRITIPVELRGHAYVQVTIQKDQDSLNVVQLTSSGGRRIGMSNLPPTADHPWQRILEAAQNVLFCKELFARLAREAVFLQAQVPPFVVENKIVVSLFPGIHLVISLVHNTDESAGDRTSMMPSIGRGEHDVILEHSMHQALLQAHQMNLGPPAPHPSSAPMGPRKKRRIAGPAGADYQSLLDIVKEETILEKIVKQGQHIVMRTRAAFLIDNLAKDIKDPCISSHWNIINSPILSTVKISIATHGYDSLWRTTLVLHVSETSIKCITRDGKLHLLSYESQELRDLILVQVGQHHLTVAQCLARFLSWQVLGSTQNVGHGTPEPLANPPACLLESPFGNRVIAVKCGPQSAQPQVFIAKYPSNDDYKSSFSKDSFWTLVQTNFEEVDLDQVDGKNFIQKLESVMAMLTHTMEKKDVKNEENANIE